LFGKSEQLQLAKLQRKAKENMESLG
jgi:hypothetical protein